MISFEVLDAAWDAGVCYSDVARSYVLRSVLESKAVPTPSPQESRGGRIDDLIAG